MSLMQQIADNEAQNNQLYQSLVQKIGYKGLICLLLMDLTDKVETIESGFRDGRNRQKDVFKFFNYYSELKSLAMQLNDVVNQYTRRR